MQRYFAIEKINDSFLLSNNDIHHLLHVMRSKENDLIEIVYENKLFLCSIFSINPLNIKIKNEILNNNELNKSLTLFYCLSKGNKIDFIVQKATELGVNEIVLINSKRSVVKYDEKDIDKKISRFSTIAKEASQQSKRILVPTIKGPFNLLDLSNHNLPEENFLAYEDEHDKGSLISIDLKNNSFGIMIGPEGGFDTSEILYLNSIGFKNVSLGKRILRTETAAVNALSIIAYLIEK